MAATSAEYPNIAAVRRAFADDLEARRTLDSCMYDCDRASTITVYKFTGPCKFALQNPSGVLRITWYNCGIVVGGIVGKQWDNPRYLKSTEFDCEVTQRIKEMANPEIEVTSRSFDSWIMISYA